MISITPRKSENDIIIVILLYYIIVIIFGALKHNNLAQNLLLEKLM